MRSLAWLYAVPRPPEGSKRAAAPANKINRIDAMKQRGEKVTLPPNPAPYIVGYLSQLGVSEAAGMSTAPVSWTEIEAWQRLSGIALLPWEARAIRGLSAAYVIESRAAEEETCPPPWKTPVVSEASEELARLTSVLG